MKKVTSLFLLVLLLLVGCTVPGKEETVHFAEGYTVYYNAGNKMESEIAQYLYSKLCTVCENVFLSDDRSAPAEKGILIGSLCTETAKESLTAGHGAVIRSGFRIELAGFTDQMTCYAVDHFITANVMINTLPQEGVADVPTPIACEYKTVVCGKGERAADPWVVRREDTYYYCWSGDSTIYVKKMDNLDEIAETDGSLIWKGPQDTLYSHEFWAPELHYLQGQWYIYFAADDGSDANHKMYVLRGTTQDPTDPFEFVGKIEMQKDMWAIDGTVMQYQDDLYFIWSGKLAGEQRIAIAHMADPITIDTKHTTICSAVHSWERGGVALCEGPVALTQNDHAVIVYSASAGWTDFYSLGALTLTGTDPLSYDSWSKRDTPLLTRDKKTFCTGHCSFVEAFDGTTWIVYHATKEHSVGFGGRESRIQPAFWNGEILIVGDPAKPDDTLYLPLKP